MKPTSRSRSAAVTTGALLSSLALAAFAAPASAATIPGSGTGNPAGWGAGYNNVINGHAAAAWLVKIEGGDVVEVYCVDEPAKYDSNPDTLYTAAPWDAAGVPKMAQAAHVAINAETIGTPLADKNSEYVARQLAVWSFTNSTDYTSVNNKAIRDRADQIKGAAKSHTEGHSSFVLKLETTQADGKNTVTATFATGTGTPIAGQDVKLAGAGIDQTVKTDDKGLASATFDAPKEAGKVTATWNGVLPAGTILVPATPEGQKVVTVKDAKIVRTAEADLAAAPAPKPVEPAPVVPVTPAPVAPAPETAPPAPAPTTAPPAPKPEAPVVAAPPVDRVKKELPYTGSPITLPVILGAAGLLGFGVWSRKRK